MDNLVFYIEKEKLLRTLLESIFKKKNAKFYSVDTLENNLYLIDDLAPTVILFDAKTVGTHVNQLLKYNNIKLIMTGSKEDEDLAKELSIKFLLKPLAVANLYDRIIE